MWGKRYLLAVVERNQKPCVTAQPSQIALTVRPGSDRAKREAVMHEWHKALLHEERAAADPEVGTPPRVRVAAYFLQRMKTKWGGCNHEARNIRLNTELVKKPKDLLEYVVVHEMAHLIAPTHSERFRGAAEPALSRVAGGAGRAERTAARGRGLARVKPAGKTREMRQYLWKGCLTTGCRRRA